MHAKSMQDFVDMLELLFPEFAFVGVWTLRTTGPFIQDIFLLKTFCLDHFFSRLDCAVFLFYFFVSLFILFAVFFHNFSAFCFRISLLFLFFKYFLCFSIFLFLYFFVSLFFSYFFWFPVWLTCVSLFFVFLFLCFCFSVFCSVLWFFCVLLFCVSLLASLLQ